MKFIKKGDLYYVKKDGVGRKKIVKDAEVLGEFMSSGMDSFKACEKLALLKEESTEEKDESEGVGEWLQQTLEDIKPFQNFTLIQTPNKTIAVWSKDGKITLYGSATGLLKHADLAQFLSISDPALCEQIQSRIAAIMYPKNPLVMTLEEALKICINGVKPLSSLPKEISNEEDLNPILVEGMEGNTLKRIPYFPKEVCIDDLNPLLKEFLGRVDNHEHLCAILWGQFTGKQWPYICYLYGKEGREGKTSFIDMLANLTGSYAALSGEDSKNTFFDLYSKAIISVPENDKGRLISSKTVKQITGGSLLKIEEKYKSSFFGKILGTLIVDANLPLRIDGRSFETERLRYFTVKKNSKSAEDRIAVPVYKKELGSTPNEFLNYCRQCCEKLITAGGILKQPENHEELMDSLADELQDLEFNSIFDKACRDLKFKVDKEASCNKAIFLRKIKDTFPNKKDFYIDTYLHFLEKKGIVIENKELKGIGFVPDGHTTFVRKS